MSTFSLDKNDALYQINAYQPGRLKINNHVYTRSIVLSPETMLTDWVPQNISDLSSKDLDPIILLKPNILLIGTGERLVFPPLSIYGHLFNQAIGVEIMDTSAACRTFNALSSENRRVVAALFVR